MDQGQARREKVAEGTRWNRLRLGARPIGPGSLFLRLELNERNRDLSTVEALPQKQRSVREHVQDDNSEDCSGSHCQHRDY
jgi:hypothetical protein